MLTSWTISWFLQRVYGKENMRGDIFGRPSTTLAPPRAVPSRPRESRPTGLANVGNSCYASALLHVLSTALPPLPYRHGQAELATAARRLRDASVLDGERLRRVQREMEALVGARPGSWASPVEVLDKLRLPPDVRRVDLAYAGGRCADFARALDALDVRNDTAVAACTHLVVVLHYAHDCPTAPRFEGVLRVWSSRGARFALRGIVANRARSHYVAFVCGEAHGEARAEDGERAWWLLNDEHVRPVGSLSSALAGSYPEIFVYARE